ncbi:MAG: hypothetical protein HYR72_21725 [Deltaproteobacteria bacterium]|nr:hypothetical protein [Deltaproteobacteria bacterium]MBI3390138.1 hypothetical protein [Deltaproteobacteria bacterium]
MQAFGTRRRFAYLLGGIIALWNPRIAAALPYVPTDDEAVLERLPVSPLDTSARKVRAMRAELAQQPGNISLATRAAWLYVEQGRARSDPRYYGYAQAALARWWASPEPPVSVLVLRATIRQHNHDFEGALSDLTRAVQADPDNTQAWLTRAVILQVRGEYAEARRSCEQGLQRATPLVAVICTSGVESLNGEAHESYAMLRRALTETYEANPGVRLWALTLLAEIAARLGDATAADAHFKQAIALGVPDDYLLAAYADFLLDQGRANAVIDLLADATRADALLLRLALAEKMAAAPGLDEHVETLRDRFAAAHLRGDTVHRREEALFALHLLKQPAPALRLARENWAVQREPSDARVLLESAIANGEPRAAQPVLDFLAQTKLEDTQLAALGERLRATRP